FVWGKSIKNNKANMVRQLEELWRYTQQVAQRELSEPEPDLGSLGPEELEAAIVQLRQTLKATDVEDDEIKKGRSKAELCQKPLAR
ncbi:MAG TPA: hypothetical protein VN367_04415, partial [Chlorobaculum sp.]|nr:hypothetical protein [Chlorobaculum sp.]